MPEQAADLALDVIEEFTHKRHTPETLPLSEQGGCVVMDNGIPVHYDHDTPGTVRVWDDWGVEYVDVTYDGDNWISGEPVGC